MNSIRHAIQYAYMADSVFLFVFVDFVIWDWSATATHVISNVIFLS